MLVLLAVALLEGASARAQAVDVTATLDATDGWVRAGAYVPVTLRATNRTGTDVAGVRVATGGPVAVAAAWRLGAGETADRVLPVYYVGGDLALEVEFRDAGGRTVGRARVAPSAARPLPDDAALVAVGEGVPDPGQAEQDRLKGALGVGSLHLLRLREQTLTLAGRCGILGATVPAQSPADGAGLDSWALQHALRAAPRVQPGAFRLFATGPWPAAQRRRLWLWLGVFTVAVVGVAAIVPRRRAVAMAAAMVLLAAAATAGLWLFGGLCGARVREARVFYLGADGAKAGALEHLVSLESRGGAAACYGLARPGVSPLPLPVLADSQDLFRPQFALVYGGEERVETRGADVLLQVVDAAAGPFGLEAGAASQDVLESVSKRPDVVAALRVEGAVARDARGRAQTVEAWAVEWQASPEADLAWAGRSLAWWNRDRRWGDGPFLLAWCQDPADDEDGGAGRRLPALVVRGPATAPP